MAIIQVDVSIAIAIVIGMQLNPVRHTTTLPTSLASVHDDMRAAIALLRRRSLLPEQEFALFCQTIDATTLSDAILAARRECLSSTERL